MELLMLFSNSAFVFMESHRIAIACTITAVCAFYAVRRWMRGARCQSKARLDGRTVLITGGNTGVGKETARDLARRGARILIAGRDLKRTNAAADEIRRTTGNDNVIVYNLDLASLKSVRECAKEVLAKEDRLDILINNAGVMITPIHWRTADGFEMQMGTNHLGHFLFTNLLLDLIKRSAPSRIINVSSLGHSYMDLDLDDLNSEKVDTVTAYGRSKLANILFTRELHRRLKGSGVISVSLHPGAVATELYRYTGDHRLPFRLLITVFWALYKHINKTPEEGAQTTLHCALEPEVEQQSGKYFSDCAVKEPSRQAQDDVMASKLWTLSEKLVGLTT
ncbi:retinol dehydrogenase 13-like [Mya arenaria]|uniref:retinol dehydrogenase 13-like n=1 Tax=Mya arenaria TaxID=6604 RepID=UPI0022E5B428|nr:retinol dehydrogenase 13-like [Mya arenaria]